VGALRDLVAGDRRLDIDKHPTGCQRGKEPVPALLAEHPVRYRENQPVEPGEPVERNQLDAVFTLGLGRVGERIVHQGGDAELAQFGDDVGDAAVSEVGHVLLEGHADNPDPRRRSAA